MPVPRSYLYVPGDRPDWMDKAAAGDADALILDLEDSVTIARKDEARAAVAGWLSSATGAHPQLWVRVNPASLDADVAAVAGPGLRGIVLPKASPALLAAAAATLALQERAKQLPSGTFAVFALLETAQAVLAASDIAAADRVARLAIGAVDLSAELGIRYDGSHLDRISPALWQAVLVSSAAGLPGPAAPTSTDLGDLSALHASTSALRDIGFRARTCIHPAQVGIVNAAFAPTDEDCARARAVIAAYDTAAARGVGVLTDPDGRMIDEAVVRQARDVIARSRER